MKCFRSLLLLTLLVTAVSCASKSEEVLQGRPQLTLAPSTQQMSGTRLARAVDPLVSRQAGKSGFRLLDRPDDAFEARLALIDAAEKTIDAQYYVWRTDASGTVLLERLLAAADRGVRVRLQVDDMLYDRDDSRVAALTVHPNIEFRLYNPLAADITRSFLRYGDLLANFGELNHRMHNKFLIADNRVAIMGGRNVGDKYYGLNRELVFRDLDVIAWGPVVPQASSAFDAYWNSERSAPIEMRFREFLTPKDSEQEHDRVRQRVVEFEREGFPYAVRMAPQRAVALLRPDGGSREEPVFWAPARLVADTLAKGDDPEAGQGSLVAAEIERLATEAQSEIVLESAYLVPGERFFEVLENLAPRGLKIRTLTNSMASTNHIYVHSFYAKTRRRMIDLGVSVHEVNTDAASRSIHAAYAESKLGLHAKTLIFDRQTTFVGTFNVDPRSEKWNSESGVFIDSKAFAEHLLQRLERDFDPANSWQVRVDDDGDMIWEGVTDGEPVVLHKEPGTSGSLRFKSWFFGLLPLREQV